MGSRGWAGIPRVSGHSGQGADGFCGMVPKCRVPPGAQRSHHATAHFCSRLNQQKEMNKEQTTGFKRWKEKIGFFSMWSLTKYPCGVGRWHDLINVMKIQHEGRETTQGPALLWIWVLASQTLSLTSQDRFEDSAVGSSLWCFESMLEGQVLTQH